MSTPSITVHQFPPFLQMQPSPFGLKLETWLRMKELPYASQGSFTKMGPKNKVPFAEIDGQLIGDSELIIERINDILGGDNISELTAMERAKSLVIRRLVEEHLYFVLMHSRWIDDAGWEVFAPLVFGHIPTLIRPIIRNKIRKIVRQNLVAQGISRHTNEEIYAKGEMDIQALSGILGDNLYFIGSKPGLTDASAYGLLANIVYAPLRSPLLDAVTAYPNLLSFCDRMRAEFWPESPRGGGEKVDMMS
ncbi:MAG: glutathione S-transferase family protein [Proteobacteria bacterium]|nr:glutathione S-transferase family protein [Pseudomonadota bacterium]